MRKLTGFAIQLYIGFNYEYLKFIPAGPTYAMTRSDKFREWAPVFLRRGLLWFCGRGGVTKRKHKIIKETLWSAQKNHDQTWIFS